MKIAVERAIDRLAAEAPCLGALFTSYSFDPAFFEEHVLRAVLRLTSDPVEQAEPRVDRHVDLVRPLAVRLGVEGVLERVPDLGAAVGAPLPSRGHPLASCTASR